MLKQLGQTLREIRDEAEVKRVHIAAELDVTESSVWRVETGKGWPRDADKFVAAYEVVCGVPAADVWRRATTDL